MMLLGCISIAVPALVSVGIAVFIGWVLVVASGCLLAAALRPHPWVRAALRAFWAALTIAVGIWLVVEPHNGTVTLTFALGVYLLLMGVTRLGAAIAARGRPGAGLLAVSGAAGAALGALILAKLPSSADWAIGLLVGIDLLLAGWALLSLPLLEGERVRPASPVPDLKRPSATTIPE